MVRQQAAAHEALKKSAKYLSVTRGDSQFVDSGGWMEDGAAHRNAPEHAVADDMLKVDVLVRKRDQPQPPRCSDRMSIELPTPATARGTIARLAVSATTHSDA
jgi:hypothetical protein